jgi:hypothetical protein
MAVARFVRFGNETINLEHIERVVEVPPTEAIPDRRCRVHLASGQILDLLGQDAEELLGLVHGGSAQGPDDARGAVP